MDKEQSFRVGTTIKYKRNDQTIELQDVCLIYPDEVNEDSCVAVSKKTSKVGVGDTVEEAYINLIVVIVCTMRHLIKCQPNAQIGIPATGKKWEDFELNSVHRLDNEIQLALLDKVYSRLQLPKPKLAEETRATDNKIIIERDVLSETLVLDSVLIANETAMGFDIDI